LKCAICGEFNEQDNFACPECNRENLCGSHYNFDFLICSECADKKAPVIAAPPPKKEGGDSGADAMAAVEDEGPESSPFYERTVKCPVCNTPNDLKWFKGKTYSEREVDLDKHVGSFAWTEKSYEKYHPPLFYMWHCQNCHYTDAYMEFENPDKDTYSNFRFLKEVFVDSYHDDDRVEKIVDKLGENINYEKINYYQSIKMHLLAIFIQEMLEDPEEIDDFKIGRYYLRTGWLFRELNMKKDIDEKVKVTLGKLIEYLKKGWPEVAANEKEALHKAIDHLNKAFTNSQAIKSIVAEIDLLLMIAGIHLKIDEKEKGLKLLNTVLARGQKTKQKLEGRIKEADKADKPFPPEEMRRYDMQLKRMDALMSKARDTMSDLKSAKAKKEREKAKVILKSLGVRPPLEIRAALIKKGISERLATEMTPEPKKKFLGLF